MAAVRTRSLARAAGPTVVLLVLVLSLLAVVPSGRAAAATTPLTGTITGAATVGEGLNATYHVTATGGPALAANGTQVGIYDYKASLAGPNISAAGAAILPSTGVLINQAINLTLKAPKATELITLYVLVTSTLNNTNTSQNLSYAINVVQPYVLTANLVVVGPSSVAPFGLSVMLDGAPVGTVPVPGLSPGASYPVSFSYVPTGLSPGWHTFSISLAGEHGLVAFSGGTDVYSTTFYVAGPPPNYSLWYATGAVAFVGVVFIWSTRVGARRRGRPKK